MEYQGVKYARSHIMGLFVRLTIAMIFSSGFIHNAAAEEEKRCLIVGSYHDEFPGHHLKVESARRILEGYCDIRQFNMDTKRNPAPAFGEKMALEAKTLIESWKPDVVIAIDDNASKYLVEPYFKNGKIPFVFSGLDWTAKEYGYPYTNATGMIEVTPLKQLVRQLQRITPEAKRAVCIRPDRLSAKKNYDRYQRVFASKGIEVVDSPVASMEEFEQSYRAAQEADFIILLPPSGIEGWEDARAKRFIFDHSQKLVVSQFAWIAPFTMLAITLAIEEQGEYAAEVALKILAGASPADFPIIANRRWNIYVNEHLLKKTGIKLPADLLRKAEKID